MNQAGMNQDTRENLSAGIDGAFHLVAKISGQEAAHKTATHMEYRWKPDPNLRGTN